MHVWCCLLPEWQRMGHNRSMPRFWWRIAEGKTPTPCIAFQKVFTVDIRVWGRMREC